MHTHNLIIIGAEVNTHTPTTLNPCKHTIYVLTYVFIFCAIGASLQKASYGQQTGGFILFHLLPKLTTKDI